MQRESLTLPIVPFGRDQILAFAARREETERLDATYGPRCGICKRRPFESCERDGCPRA